MAELIFPSGGVARAKTLLSLLGSFWNIYFDDRAVVEGCLQARSKQELQTFQDLLEAVRCASRYDVPIFHRKNWQLLLLRASQRLSAEPADYGDAGIVYGPDASGTTVVYGTGPYAYVRYPGPDDLEDAPSIHNRLTEPSVSWVKDLDYVLNADKTISFLKDPFAYPDLIPQRPVFDSKGLQIDSEIGLWIFQGDFDWTAVYDHWGFILGILADSSEAYLDLINVALDAVVGGTTLKQIERALVAMAGIPVVIEAQETVELIERDASFLLIGTDKHVYKFRPSVQALVSINDVLRSGDRLVDAFEIIELNNGVVPDHIQALSLGPNLLVPSFQGDLTFSNQDVDVVVTTDAGKTRIDLALGGLAADVDKFWDEMHTRGIAAGQTLAESLDSRTNPTGQPTAANLPTKINPLKFLVDNVLKYHSLLIHIKAGAAGVEGVGLEHARIIRRILSPHHLLLIIISLTASTDQIVMDGLGDINEPGYNETLLLTHEMNALGDSIDDTLFAEAAVLSQIS